MSGCRQQKLDLKPKIVCARINKKKDLEPKISVCKSNNVTSAAAPHIKAASDHKVVPCRIPTSFLRFE